MKRVSKLTLSLREQFPNLYEEHYNYILRVCIRMVGAEDAEDLTQDTFIRAWRFLHQFKGGSQFRTWLYRIAINQCKMMLRKKSLIIVPMKDAKGLEIDINEELIRTQTPLHIERIDIIHAVGSLPEIYKESFELTQYDGLLCREVSKRIRRPITTVKTRLNRARIELRIKLGGQS